MSESSIEATIRFSIVPESVSDYEASGLSANAVRLYAILDRYGNSEGALACPSRRTLARRCGLSTDTIDRVKAELVRSGYLEVIRRPADAGDHDTNEYRLHREGGRTEGGSRTRAATGSRIGAGTGSRTDAAQQRAPMTESSASPNGESGGDAQPNGQSFVSFFVDESRRVSGKDPLTNALARLGRDAGKLAGQGVSEETIRTAITELVETGMHVGAFAGLVDQVHRGGYRGGRNGSGDLTAADLMAKSRELEAAGR